MDQTTTIDKLASDLISTMPDPNPAAIEAGPPGGEAPTAPAAEAPSGFNPAIHAADADGNPILTKDGAFRNKPGRKKGPSVVGSPSTDNMAKPQQPSKAEIARIELENRAAVAGAGAANLLITAGVLIGGPDFVPGKSPLTGLDEREFLTGEFKQYFIATNRADLPPGLALAAAVLIYVAPRFAKPAVAIRFAGMKSWIVSKFKKK